MKNYRFLLIILAALLLFASVAFVSCNEAGDETTAGTDGTTSAPESSTPAEESTAAPESTEESTTEPPHTHSFGEWTTVKAASCSEEGISERSCACGHKETEAIAKAEHKAGEWIIDKEATATEEGSKRQVCSVCGETLKTEVIPANPHTPGEWIVDKEATCTEDGARHRVCTKCGETVDSEVLPAKGHTEVVDPAKNATCTEDGATEGKHCSVCSEILKAQEVIAAPGHSEKLHPAKAASCTESGITEGKSCTACGAVLTAQQTLPALGHKEGEWITDKAPTYTETGSRHTECSRCGVTVRTETVPVLERVKLEYSVTLLDGYGVPVSGAKITFASGNTVAAEAVTDSDGKASVKLYEGEYEATSDPVDGYYSSASVTLTADKPSDTLTIIAYATNPQLQYPDEVNGVYSVSVGSIRVPVENGVMRYFFFAPQEGAIYRVYTDSEKVGIGYYGGSFFVSETNSGKMLDDGGMELEVLHSAVGGVLVIGLKSTSSAVSECTLTIVRYSDVGIKDVERPWEQYQLGHTPTKLETPAGTIQNVPITVILPASGAVSEIPVYYNANDGYYHLNSETGPILYVRINTASLYQEALATIAGVTNIGRYFYDEQGNFVKKESYNDAILAYAEAADSANGVVPLDSDLVYILKNIGENGWYDGSSPNCIFTDNSVIVMPFNGWLFACVYFE